MAADSIIRRVLDFTKRCLVSTNAWKFSSAANGPETLYASCFACMIFHYLGELNKLKGTEKEEWARYLSSWQDPATGRFIGPEIVPEELTSLKHDWNHVTMHLTAHVLPALHLLGARPAYPLKFAHRFLDLETLRSWLNARDWRQAWLEGNNLLFIGQFLIHIRDVENRPSAQTALNLYFDWLHAQQDPKTGLWGSNGYCSNANALYGGYHQLLVYYYEGWPVRFPERLIDVALSLQHADGGFNPAGGGGACEDTDVIDVLVNMYKRVDYKRPQIRVALRKALNSILERQVADGGFVYRLNQPFMHMGIQKTATPANTSNLFSTWFRVHTLALISEILSDEPKVEWPWGFNKTCSMGWHRPWEKTTHKITFRDSQVERLRFLANSAAGRLQRGKRKMRHIISRARQFSYET